MRRAAARCRDPSSSSRIASLTCTSKRVLRPSFVERHQSSTPPLTVEPSSAIEPTSASLNSSHSRDAFRHAVLNGPTLGDFIQRKPEHRDGADAAPLITGARKVFLETYGCQMNSSDSEVVLSIMQKAGYQRTAELKEADVIFVNTCAVRDNAEGKVWQRLHEFKSMRKKGLQKAQVGVLGCMAERLKGKLLEEAKLVDVVVGPDAYRDLPRLLAEATDSGQQQMNVQLSMEETYADVAPVRRPNSVSAFISIMRGCDNMCSFCIVPFTRGRERSRNAASIVGEVQQLASEGVREVTLLGQNVNSYHDSTEIIDANVEGSKGIMSRGFKTIYKPKVKSGVRFAELLHRVASVAPQTRFRFTSPHPKDFPDELLYVIRDLPNVCKSLHIPAQSGSSRVLDRMRRGYTREAYLSLIDHIKTTIPGISLSSDFISGFCGETEEDHQDTLSLLRSVQFDQAFMFAYSVREKTHAHRNYTDDVPEDVKRRRLSEVIETFHSTARAKSSHEIGKTHIVLVEGVRHLLLGVIMEFASRRSTSELSGRSDSNKKVVFPRLESGEPIMAGEYVSICVESASPLTLRGKLLARLSGPGIEV